MGLKPQTGNPIKKRILKIHYSKISKLQTHCHILSHIVTLLFSATLPSDGAQSSVGLELGDVGDELGIDAWCHGADCRKCLSNL